MQAAAIVPTVTHRVRSFLQSQGSDLKPWSGLDETYGELYALLRRKRDTPEFWEPLAGLLEAIVESASDDKAGCLPAPQAELLRSWDVEQLVKDLRQALQQEETAKTPAGFACRLPAQVMGAFLVLGLVAGGCSSATPINDAGSDGDLTADSDRDDADSDEDMGWAEGCDLDRSSVLFQTLHQSELSEYSKRDLCTCFTTLNTSWDDGLTRLFEGSSPEEIASALSEMMECCWDRYPLDQDFDEVRDRFLDGTLCFIALPYRGVAFPPKP